MTSAPEPTPKQVRIRLAGALVAIAAGAVAIVAITLFADSVLSETPPASPTGSSASGPSATSSGPPAGAFPAPPRGALVLAREDRDLAVALAASPAPGGVSLQASVIGQESPVGGLAVSFRVVSSRTRATGPAASCGPGCYETTVALAGRPERVLVAITGRRRSPTSVVFALPATWPAPDATAIVRAADRTWRSLRSLAVDDRLASGPGQAITTHWQLVAPDREAYTIEGGPQAIVIGSTRWDRDPGGQWVRSAQVPIRQPVPFWISFADAHLLGSEVLHGRPVWHVSFFDPDIRAWFELWVEKATSRTLEMRMTAQAHFMHQVYGRFDQPLRIVPPKAATS